MRAPTGVVLLLLAAAGAAETKPPYVERLSPALDAIVPRDAAIDVIATGFDWAEGPLWLPEQHMLVFSDPPANTIFGWREGEGVSTWLKPSGYTGERPRGGEPGSNGLALDARGRLILCQHGDRRIARMAASLDEPAPEFETIAARYDGHRFNSPNDLTIDSKGAIWFTDPPYGLEGGPDGPGRELDTLGVYRVAPGGEAELVVGNLTRPNGIGLSPDEATLYVSNSDPERAAWMAYRIDADGTVGDGRLLFDATAEVARASGLPDGLEVHSSGNLFASGPGGIFVLSPAGDLLGRIVTGAAAANVAFDEDESTLYITADDRVLRVDLR
ncbi:MAG TPA: SMP-30/gluconolactonase/LRE family protein [Woeseiaceae bacterium]